MTDMKEYIRNLILTWLLPDYKRYIETVDNLVGHIDTIETHLGRISEFASYVREKEERASEIFATLENTAREESDLTEEEIKQEIASAITLKNTLLGETAIGSKEVIEKNNKISTINGHIENLTAKIGGSRVNRN